MEASNSKPKLKLKLLIDKKAQKVIFAEANNEFVDYLFNLMSLPLSTIAKLLVKTETIGCIGDLYASIESLPKTYFQSTRNIEPILNPSLPFQIPQFINRNKAYTCPYRPSVLLEEYSKKSNKPFEPSSSLSSSTTSSTLYKFGSTISFSSTTAQAMSCNLGATASFTSSKARKNVDYHPYLVDDPDSPCPICHRKMSNEMQFVAPKNVSCGFGFVRSEANFVVMDNLVVKPMSEISSIDLINSMEVKDMSLLVEMVVDVGEAEGLKLLRASLQSKNVLTSVFVVENEEKYSIATQLN